MNFVAAKADGPELIGIGLYTAPEAERLIGVPVARIRRWLLGYAYQRDGERHCTRFPWPPCAMPSPLKGGWPREAAAGQ